MTRRPTHSASLVVGVLAAWLAGCGPPAPPAPVDDWSGFGDLEHVLRWTPEQQRRGYRHMDRIYPTRPVRAGNRPYPLPLGPRDLRGIRYTVDDTTFTLDDYLVRNHVVGLLVLHDGTIALERYREGQTPETRWYSFSVTKSLVSMLVGVAIHEGYLPSVDVAVTDMLPVMRRSAYEGVTLRHVLQMASGVAWHEDYDDPASDIARTGGGALDRLRYLSARPRKAPPGTTFTYNTEETNLAGAVLRAALGNNLSTYLETTIWHRFGMEHDAHWVLLSEGGAEHGGCCLSLTLRDLGRLGLFALREGRLADGTALLPDGWMALTTAASPAHSNYGSLWWRRADGAYAALGIFGQALYVDPARRLVVAMQGMWPRATGREFSAHRDAFIAAVAASVDPDKPAVARSRLTADRAR